MKPIVKIISIQAPAAKVWEALTDPEKLGEWITMPNNIKPELGSEFTFRAESRDEWGNWDKLIKCRITELIPVKKIAYTWASDLIKGETLVNIELVDNGGHTELTLTHSGWENLPENGEMWKDGHDKGWRDLLSRLTQNFAEKKNIKLIADVALFRDKETLFVKYKETNKYDHQKGWFIPDDLVIHEEHPEDAAARILKEQLGVENYLPKLVFIESFTGGDKSWHLVFHYKVNIGNETELIPASDISELSWFSIDKLPEDKEIAHHGWARFTIEEILSIKL